MMCIQDSRRNNAVKRNHLFLNPVALVERFRAPKRVLPKFITTEQLKKFFAACDEDERRLFMRKRGSRRHRRIGAAGGDVDLLIPLGTDTVVALRMVNLVWQFSRD